MCLAIFQPGNSQTNRSSFAPAPESAADNSLPTPQILHIPGSPSTILATTSGSYPFHFDKFPDRSLDSEHFDRLFPIINEIEKGMSPFLQRKTPDSTRSPQQWFRPAPNQSVPYLAKSPHPNRALGFSSIKQLARSSRIPPTNTRPTGTDPQPIHRLRSQSSLYGTLRDQCTPPESSKSLGNNPHHTYDDRHHSHNSSSDSVTPDQSDLTVGPSSPIAPSPAGRNPFYKLAATSSLQSKSMGQWQSTIARKPLSVKAKQSLAIIRGDSHQQRQEDEVNNPSPQPTSGVQPKAKSSLVCILPQIYSKAWDITLLYVHVVGC